MRGDNRRRRPSAKRAQQIITTPSNRCTTPRCAKLIVDIKDKNEIIIDHVSADEVLEAGFSPGALDRAKGMVQSFEQFIKDHKDEITALQVLYSKPYKHRLTFEAVKELADAIEKPPYLWNESQLWNAYAALEKSKVKGASGKRILTDLVSLVRFAIHQDNELIPFPERVNANFKAWLASRKAGGQARFTDGTTALARNDPRPHRREPRHRAGRLRVRTVRAARRPRQGASTIRRQAEHDH